MKKQILSLAIVAAMTAAIATGCSSTKDAGSSKDTTKIDSASSTTPAANDTVKKDTAKKM